MISALLRILFFVALVVFAALLAERLMEASGGVRVAIMDTEFTLGPLEAVIAALLLVLVVWLVFKLIGLLIAVVRFLSGDDTALSRHFSRRRERKGFEALADGLLALASGEGERAMSRASRAERYLDRPELTDLITAQAAEMTGNRTKAEAVYKRLVTYDRTRFVGVRGLMRQKLAEGDTETAMKLAEKAFALKPRHEETQDVLLRLQAEQHDWSGARNTLRAKLKHGAIPRDVHRRRDAVLALSEARDVVDEGKTIEAREAAIEANRLSPDLVPAAVDGGARLHRAGQAALRRPRHPQGLGGAAASRPRGGLRRDRARRGPGGAHKAVPDAGQDQARPSRNAAADERAAYRRRGFPGRAARAGRSGREAPDGARADHHGRHRARRGRGRPRGARLARAGADGAAGAAMGLRQVPARSSRTWAPVCGNCGAFDTLSWREPPADEIVMPAGVEMMPLLVGGRPETTLAAPIDATEPPAKAPRPAPAAAAAPAPAAREARSEPTKAEADEAERQPPVPDAELVNGEADTPARGQPPRVD